MCSWIKLCILIPVEMTDTYNMTTLWMEMEVDSRGETPFYLALRNEHESTAAVLLNTGGADPNERDHGCQMAIAKFLDCMRLALWA